MIVRSNAEPHRCLSRCLHTSPRDTTGPDVVATAREKQDEALADYRRAKDREHVLADLRGQSDTDVPLSVDLDDAELRSAIDADISAQEALSVALRAVDD